MESIHPKKTLVLVIAGTDDTVAEEFIGLCGYVIDHNSNGMTGNTPENPLHVVEFEDGIRESYWFEELKPLKGLKYYQPDMNHPNFKRKSFFSFEVYLKRENAVKDFPNVPILEYENEDIMFPTFIDIDRPENI